MPHDHPAADEAIRDALAARSPGATLSLLLEVARAQAARRTPAEVLRQFAADPFVRPGALDLRRAHQLDGLALDAADGFEAVLLSPLAPLGMCGVVGAAGQDRVVSTLRGTEVVSDPTNALALLCAERLKASPEPVRLATLHQVVRAQRFPPKSGFTQHFRMFALAWAGGAGPDQRDEVAALVAQLVVHDRLCTLAEGLGCRLPGRRVTIYTGDGGDALRDRVRERAAAELPHVAFDDGRLASTYYDGLRMLFGAERPGGEFTFVADVGRFDWMARLTSNRRHRFVASGLGVQLLPLLFGA